MSKGLIQFAVNGEKVIVDQDNEMTLLQYLRRELGLVGTKMVARKVIAVPVLSSSTVWQKIMFGQG